MKMDFSKDSYCEKSLHATSTNKNETAGSSFSSDNDQAPKSTKKKRKEKKTSKQSFTPDYFPIYTPPWATMNYLYFDLLRQLSLESETRSSLTKMDKKHDKKYFKDCQTKDSFEEEQCCSRRQTKHKIFSCEDVEMSCAHLCLSCYQKIKCSSCGQSIKRSREPETALQENKPLNYCKCVYGSCPTLLDVQHIPCHYHCQKLMDPYHSLEHNICGILNPVSVVTPVRKQPEMFKSTRRAQSSLDLKDCNESDYSLDKLTSENCISTDNSIANNFGTNTNQTVLQMTNKDSKKHDFEDDLEVFPSFVGGTGDEGAKLQVNRSRKSCLPRSTAYFLPVSCLSTK